MGVGLVWTRRPSGYVWDAVGLWPGGRSVVRSVRQRGRGDGRVRLEGSLGAAAPAGAATLRDGLRRLGEWLLQQPAEPAWRLAGPLAADADHLLAAALGAPRQAREDERADQEEHAEADDDGDDHGSWLPSGPANKPTATSSPTSTAPARSTPRPPSRGWARATLDRWSGRTSWQSSPSSRGLRGEGTTGLGATSTRPLSKRRQDA